MLGTSVMEEFRLSNDTDVPWKRNSMANKLHEEHEELHFFFEELLTKVKSIFINHQKMHLNM